MFVSNKKLGCSGLKITQQGTGANKWISRLSKSFHKERKTVDGRMVGVKGFGEKKCKNRGKGEKSVNERPDMFRLYRKKTMGRHWEQEDKYLRQEDEEIRTREWRLIIFRREDSSVLTGRKCGCGLDKFILVPRI